MSEGTHETARKALRRAVRTNKRERKRWATMTKAQRVRAGLHPHKVPHDFVGAAS